MSISIGYMVHFEPGPGEPDAISDVEKQILSRALAQFNGDQSKAARFIGITRYQLRYRAARYGLLDQYRKPAVVSLAHHANTG